MTDTPEPVEAEEQPQAPVADAPVEEILSGESDAAAVEAREDAVLMEIDGGAEDGEDDAPVAADAPDEPPTTSEPSAEMDEALSVLRRDGFQRDDLSALSDEQVLRLAEHRKKVQTDIDRMLSKAKPDEASEEQSQAEPAEPNTAEAPNGHPQQDNLRQAAALFGEHVGLDTESTELLAKSYEAILAPMQEQVQAVNHQLAMFQIEQARTGLVGQYPQVADTAGKDWERVLGRMTKLQDSGGYDTVADLMEDAIAFEFRDQYKEQAQSAKKTIRSLRANGSPSNSKGASSQSPGTTSGNLEDDILNLLESGAPDRLQRARELGRR